MGEYRKAALELVEHLRQVRARRRLYLAAERVKDGILASQRGELHPIGKTGRLKRQISVMAVMNAVDSEGREVLSKAGEGYWKDQDRREFGIVEGANSARVMKNRHGRVSFRKVYGKTTETLTA